MLLNAGHIEAIKEVFPGTCYKLLKNKIDVNIDIDGSGIHIDKKGDDIRMTLKNYGMLMRGIMLVQERIDELEYIYDEKVSCDRLGFMLDCSKDAVIGFEGFKKMMQCAARMGYSVCQLGIENTYDMEDYPYYGHLRGAYTKDELKKMDEYAGLLGIELVPAIQPMANLQLMMKWPMVNEDKDTQDESKKLMISNPRVYVLIERMISHLADCMHTRRININVNGGIDIGGGSEIKRMSDKKKKSLYFEHIKKVTDICIKYDMVPMVCADALFNDAETGEEEWLGEGIFKNVIFSHSRFMRMETCEYDRKLSYFSRMADNVILASGAVKPAGYYADNALAIKVAEDAYRSAVRNGVKDILVTNARANGVECLQFASLPELQTWAELFYTGNSEGKGVCDHFMLCCGGDIKDFCLADSIGYSPFENEGKRSSGDAPRYLFYEDILSGLFDAQYDYAMWSGYYNECYEKLDEASKRYGSSWRYMFDTQKYVAKILSIKCRIGVDIRRAYQSNDRKELKHIADNVLRSLLCDVIEFGRIHTEAWLKENKAAGLEAFDLKIGGLQMRIERAIMRLNQLLNNEVYSLEELEESILAYDPEDKSGRIGVSRWSKIISAREI